MASTDVRNSSESLEQTIPGAFPPGAGSPADPSQHSSAEASHQSLQHAIHARRSEFTRQKTIRIKVGTWNVASLKGTEKDVAGWFVRSEGVTEALTGLDINKESDYNLSKLPEGTKDDVETPQAQEARRTSKQSTLPRNDSPSLPSDGDIGIYALGLQEVVDITSPAEALRPYTDPGVAKRFKDAIQQALPSYQLVSEQQLIGLLLLIYAAPSVTSQISSISTTSVGTGLMGYMGNKGAVTTRLVLGETTRLVFVNCHLGAGADKAALDRRNWDAEQIVSRTKFDPVADPLGVPNSVNENFGEEDFAFWFGDLNYRLTGMPGDDIRRLLTLHIRNEYGISRDSVDSSAQGSSDNTETSSARSLSSISSAGDFSTGDHKPDPAQLGEVLPEGLAAAEDPMSLQTTLASLLPHDELHKQQVSRKAFYDGWREGKIEFLPTYKYDVGSVGRFDSSEKKRCPSWCDRILYRTRKDKLSYDQKVQVEEAAKKKDEEMKARGMEQAGDDEDVLFDYDPDADAADDYDEFAEPEPEVVSTKSGYQDIIFQEYYAAHQRVLSSDHKPLDSIFKLTYDSVIPELRTRVHQEVAKELDRAENEGRPAVTMIVDRSHETGAEGPLEDIGGEFEVVNFGDVRFGQSKTRTVTIANTGRVPATIYFADRPVSADQPQGAAPPWLSIRFDREPDQQDPKSPSGVNDAYTIQPGDSSTVDLILKVEVMELVRSLNEAVANIDDILVLRVESGRDHFLPIRGRWMQSTFAQSIEKLIKIPEGGIRKLQGQKPSSDSKIRHGVKWSAPRELFRLTESIEDLVERTLAEWEMTAPSIIEGDSEAVKPPWRLHAGWPFAAESWTLLDNSKRDALKLEVFEALDTDSPFDKIFLVETSALHRLEIFSEILMLFLQSLPDGVIPAPTFTELETHLVSRDKVKHNPPLSVDDQRIALLEILASSIPTHNVTFILLTEMISRVLLELSHAFPSNAGNKNSKRFSSSNPKDLPATPSSTPAVHRKSLSLDAQVARMQIVRRSLAGLFANAIIRVPEVAKERDKDRRAREEKALRIVEIFLREGSTPF